MPVHEHPPQTILSPEDQAFLGAIFGGVDGGIIGGDISSDGGGGGE